ncbi:hypothetical protein PR202_gb08110 [Eleusine coracana subsp. coracana]|uniref:Sodium/calcium exchanger membrane region domain-containing protein n=1 Tax=Eleusine coracana subsp. coracana TaxID=191504 RepID=A0AAV5EDA2_ELECO|nr:hypothetical protein PR202_gb08110 [Eleusine coracana subsp. coracana]
MARRHPLPREAAPGARAAVTAACLNVALLLAAAVGLSRLATDGDVFEATSAAFPNNNRGEHSSLTGHGAARPRPRQRLEIHEDDRCAAGGDHATGAGSDAYPRQGTGTAAAVVGLSGVLGGAMFVSTAVLGVIGLRLGGQGVAVDRASFFRDAGFLLLALAAVAVILAVGEVTIWGAAAFVSIYLVYVLAVVFTPDRWSRRQEHEVEAEHAAVDFSELHSVAETKFYADQEAQQGPLLLTDDDAAPLLQHYAGSGAKKMTITRAFWAVVRAMDLLLRLPRQLTIPDATSKERWSKPTAVTTATLAPLLLSFLCRDAVAGSNPHLALLLGILTGLALGTLAFLTTDTAAPPTHPIPLAAWLAGEFVMSVAWAYVAAHEVLALLAAAGAVLSVDAAALGVTVLAWGNSLGDLVTNVAVAASYRAGGAQVAVSGCYGGPVFNVLVGPRAVLAARVLGRVPAAGGGAQGGRALPDAGIYGCGGCVGRGGAA